MFSQRRVERRRREAAAASSAVDDDFPSAADKGSTTPYASMSPSRRPTHRLPPEDVPSKATNPSSIQC